MNYNELLNVLLHFKESTDNVILIDGPWGSGKTYLINEYIKIGRETTDIYYVSMLGKTSVDEINTSLYIEVNHNGMISSSIPSSINPIRLKYLDTLNLERILKLDLSCNCVVIFDDFERYASSDYKMFLSYVSGLVLAGAKIVVVSNLEDLGSGELFNFNEVKEKIFDHIYVASLEKKDIFKIKFGKYYEFLSTNSKYFINYNLRLIDKIVSFLKEVTNHNKEALINKDFVFFTSAVLSIFYQVVNKSQSDIKIRCNKEDKSIIEHFLNDNCSLYYWDFLRIYDILLNLPIIKEYIRDNLLLILKIYKTYLSADYSIL